MLTVQSPGLTAQSVRPVPRPPAQQPGAPPAGTIAPDGYAPIPGWAGQTRAPRPAVSVPYDVETVATGITGGFAFHFLPDGRFLLTERPGRLRTIDASGRLSNPVADLPEIWAGGPQGLFEAIPDHAFAKNRLIYFTYTARPPGA